MSDQNGVVIRTHTSADIALRMDASNCTGQSTGPGCGTVNCQFNPGPWERFNILPQDDGTVAIESVQWPGRYLRMDGGSGQVNCQCSIGPWEKFHIQTQPDGTKAIESAQWPGYYLHINTQGVTHFNPAGWPNTASCNTGVDEAAKFEFDLPVAGKVTVTNLALHYNSNWSTSNPTIFNGAKMTIVNGTGSTYPAAGQSTWVSLDVYASTTSTKNDNMQKIGEVAANVGSIAPGGSFAFTPSNWEDNGLAKMVTTNPAFPASGQYYIYIQVRNPEGTIDGNGAFSSETYQLPPS